MRRSDRRDPVLQGLDIALKFRRLGHSSTCRCRLMAGQPSRTFGHRDVQGSTIFGRYVGDRGDMLCLNTGAVPLDNSAQKNFLKRAFPCFAQQAVEVLGLLFVGVLMTITKKLVSRRGRVHFPRKRVRYAVRCRLPHRKDGCRVSALRSGPVRQARESMQSFTWEPLSNAQSGRCDDGCRSCVPNLRRVNKPGGVPP
jgi:hypothetical protein